ncbi:MAG: hypothetical protein QM680_08570 [Luteolibacter sp.]
MNRRRNEARTPAYVYFALILAFCIAAAGGVLHAFYKNRQVLTARAIEASERRMEQAQLDIRTVDMRMDQLLNRYVIRKQLEETRSKLRPIPVGLVEEVDPTPPIRHSVASADP